MISSWYFSNNHSHIIFPIIDPKMTRTHPTILHLPHMVPPFSNDFPMISPMIFSMIPQFFPHVTLFFFHMFSSLSHMFSLFPCDFPYDFLSLSMSFPHFTHDFPMIFPWFSRILRLRHVFFAPGPGCVASSAAPSPAPRLPTWPGASWWAARRWERESNDGNDAWPWRSSWGVASRNSHDFHQNPIIDDRISIRIPSLMIGFPSESHHWW